VERLYSFLPSSTFLSIPVLLLLALRRIASLDSSPNDASDEGEHSGSDYSYDCDGDGFGPIRRI
jgi:hypothetical protein